MLRPRTMIAGWIAAVLACAVGCSGIPRPEPTSPTPPVTTSGGNTVVVSTPPQPCCKTSVWDILGVPQMAKVGGFIIRRVRSRLGSRFPGLEPQPELLTITDPANLESPYPSVAAAAEIKAEQDAAPQKIKAIGYLATLGCTKCYPDVEKAFLASLDDCNEEVRYATVIALRETNGSPCHVCKWSSCCSPAILRKLEQMAFDTDEYGCFVEPSPRVRRMARLAFRGCGNMLPVEVAPESIEGPTPADVEGPAEPPPAAAEAPVPPPPATAASADGLRSVLVSQSALPELPADGVLATVNGEFVLYRDLASEIESRLAAIRAGALLDAERKKTIVRQVIDEAIQRKLLCQDAMRANFPQAIALVSYETGAGETSSQTMGPEAERRIAQQWLEACTWAEASINPQQIWSYYRANLGEFQRPGQVRYESISAPISQFATREEAREAIAFVRNQALGNQEEPPPRGVHKMNVETHDWASADDLPSAAVKQTLLSMPVGSISSVLEGKDGFIVVRLLERRPPTAAPVERVAEEIRVRLVAARRAQAAREYVDALRRGARIWSPY